MAGSISQAFDRAGRITSDGRSLTGVSGDAGTGTQSFAYDALSRLTGSTGLALSRSYQYDLDGNRTAKVEGSTITTYTYDRADQVANQVIGATTRTFDYDRYGNLLTSADNASAVTTYAYDEASRLTTISPPGGAATQMTLTLDALGRHATRAVNASTTDTYAYLDATETAWQTGAGTATSALLDAEGSRLALKTGGTVSWLVFDLHGSVVALCPAGTSSLSDAYRFDGFGQQIASAGTAANPWRYRGLLNIGSDAMTGALLDMGARDYSPQLGAFTQQDSVQGSAANPMSMNRFLYALANPATLIDPDGHRACLDEGSSCVVVDMQTKEPIQQAPASANAVPTGATDNEQSNAQITGCDRECQRLALVTGPAPSCDRACETGYTPTITDFGCSTVSVGLGLLLSLQTCNFHYDGKFYTATTGGIGYITGATISVTFGPASTNASQPEDLGEWFSLVGGSGGRFGLSGGTDRSTGTTADGRTIEVNTFQGGIGGGFPFVELHEQATYTWVDEFDQATFDDIWGNSGVIP